MQNPSAEANQQDFQDSQLALLDSISDESPENVLQAAQRINLISDDIRKKIEADLPSHAMHFRLNLAKESSKGAQDKDAFRRAFMTTYGKFILEQQTEVTKPDGEYVDVLNKVLRPENRIGEHGLLKGRSELVASGAMLHMMTSSKIAKADVQRRIAVKETEKGAEQAKRPPYEADNAFLDTKSPDVDKIKLPADFEASVAQLTVASENREYVDRMGELRDMLGYFKTTVDTHLVPTAPDSSDRINVAINRFDAMVGAPKIDIDELKALLEENIKPLLRELRKEKPYKGDDGKYPDHDTYKANLKKADDSFKFLSKDKNVGQLEARKTNTKDTDLTASGETTEYACFRKENTTNFEYRYDGFKAQLAALNPTIEALRDDAALENSVPGFKQKCIDYLTAFATFQGRAAVDLTPAELKAFIDTVFKPFAESLKQLIANKKFANNQALAQIAARISAIESDITKLKAFDGTAIEQKIQEDIKREQAKLPEAQAKQQEAQTNFDLYNGLSSQFNAARSPIANLEADITGETNRDDLKRQIGELEGEISDLGTQITNHVNANPELDALKSIGLSDIVDMGEADIETLRGKLDVVILSRNVFGINSAKKLTQPDVDSIYNKLKSKYDPEKYKIGDHAREKAERQLRIIEECYAVLNQALQDGNVGPVPKNPIDELFRLKREYVNKQRKKKRLDGRLRKSENGNKLEPDKVFGALDAFRDSIAAIKDTPNIGDDLKSLCEGYLSAYHDDLETHRSDATFDAQLFVDFIQQKLNPFLTNFSAAVSTKRNEARNGLDARTAEIGAIQEKLDELMSSSPLTRILEKAFPGVKIKGGKVTIRGFETNFRHVAKKLEAAHEYFDSPDHVPNLRELATSLNNLLSGPAEGQPSPLLGLMNEVKDEAKIDPESGIHSQINRLKQFIESKNRSLTTAPNETQLSKTLDQLQQRHRGSEPFDRKAERAKILEPYQTERNAQDDYISKLRELERTLTDILEQSKKLHEAMKILIGHLSIVNKAGIKLSVNGREIDIGKVIKDFNEIDLRSGNFKPKQLLDVYDQIKDFFAEDSNIGRLLKEIHKAKTEVSTNINLTDPQAAKRIVTAIIAEQYPDMPLEEQQKLATLILSDNVSTIQTLESYENLAKRGSAELFDTVQAAAIKQKLIGMEFKVGEKAEQPFKDLKPENFSTPSELEKLFASGRLNYQNGFLVLAAFEEIGGEVCAQTVFLRKRLKTALAEKLKVQDKMDESGKNKIVDKAFAKSLKKAKEAYKAYSDHFDANKDTWNEYSVKELDTEFDKLEELHKLGMKDDIYYKRRAELLKKARETGVEDRVKFAEDSAFAGYWSSKESQWLKDLGYNVGAYAGGKALAVGKMGLGLTGRALWRTTKVIGGTALQLGVATPLRVGVKYPLMFAGKVAAFPFRMINNFFRKTKWGTPFELGKTVRADLAKTFNYFPETAGKVAAGAKASLKEVPKKEWGEAKFADKKYKDRTKVDQKEMDERIKELAEKAKRTPVLLGESPYIDLAPFEKEIEQTNQMLAGTGGASQGEVKKAA